MTVLRWIGLKKEKMLFTYFLDIREVWEKKRERNIDRLPFAHAAPRDWPPTRACALGGN